MDYKTTIKGRVLEYFDEDHLYLVDGVIVPSITQILKQKFSKKYEGVSTEILNRAAEAGTNVHEAIEKFVTAGEESDLLEVRNFKFLQRQYAFTVKAAEVPVILFHDDEPIAAGRLDLVIQSGDKLGLADIKRTSVLDKEYLAYQLNLYRIAYQQCYAETVGFLKGIHLRESTRKYVDIPINEEIVNDLIKQFLEKEKEKNLIIIM